MTIVLTGGGSGGHITPLLAVADELKRTQPNLKLVYIGQKGDKLADIPARSPSIDQVHTIRAGKFRRYHGEGIMQVFDLPTLAKNSRDFFLTLIGLWQSYWLLKKIKPTAIFVKGGFVVVPVGLAAAARRIPYVTHDSDALPGLANRIIGRWARIHAVGQPKEIYSYPPAKTVTVGVPVSMQFQPVDDDLKLRYRRELGLQTYKQVIFVVGGGLGAQRLNEAVVEIAPKLLTKHRELAIVQSAGRDHEAKITQGYSDVLLPSDRNRVVVKGYISDLYKYSGSADIVITRAGATNLAEFSIQQKACIIVPNPLLAGGHQLKNTDYISSHQAALVLTEEEIASDPNILLEATISLLEDSKKRNKLAARFGELAHRDSAKQLAQLVLKVGQRQGDV